MEHTANLVVLRCKGHPAISATSSKAIMFEKAANFSTGANDVIGVRAEYDEAELLSLRGAVRIILRSGNAEDVLLARVNPLFRKGNPIALRRTEKPQENTFCFAATKSAAALDRRLVDELRRPNAELEVVVQKIDSPEMADNGGAVFLIGMPIGNPWDISQRALDTLDSVDLILCEDTRTTRVALARYGIRTKTMSFHGHNETARTGYVMDLLMRGQRLALVSDAGMPVHSDPGLTMVQAARRAGHQVTVVPGPDAVTSAITVSGLWASDYRFVGFLPRKRSIRRRFLRDSQSGKHALVFFESIHRLEETLEDLHAVWPKRHVAICRDITKPHECVFGGPPSVAIQAVSRDGYKSGEFVVVVQPPDEDVAGHEVLDASLERLVVALLAEGCTAKQLMTACRAALGLSHNLAFEFVNRCRHHIPKTGAHE